MTGGQNTRYERRYTPDTQTHAPVPPPAPAPSRAQARPFSRYSLVVSCVGGRTDGPCCCDDGGRLYTLQCVCIRGCICTARADNTEYETEVSVLYPTDLYRNAWQQSRPFSDTTISPIGWADAVESVSACSVCMRSADAVAAGVLTPKGQAAVEEGLVAWETTQRIARQQHAASRRGAVLPPPDGCRCTRCPPGWFAQCSLQAVATA